MEYDPMQFRGAARYYWQGRPPYSAQLGALLADELGLDGTGHLVDVGCGPGTLALELAPLFERVTLVEPDADMLAEARRFGASAGMTRFDFVQATAEQIGSLGLASVRVVTFGQSFHRVDRELVAAAVADLLAPDGALVLVSHDASRPPPAAQDAPPVPHREMDQLVASYLGALRRSCTRPASDYESERFEVTLERTPLNRARVVHAPGRPDVLRDVDGVIAGCLSMSYSAPHLFGDRLNDFVMNLRTLLESRSPDGVFWDWPGDTEIVIAQRT